MKKIAAIDSATAAETVADGVKRAKLRKLKVSNRQRYFRQRRS
jgi:hypothetical protein